MDRSQRITPTFQSRAPPRSPHNHTQVLLPPVPHGAARGTVCSALGLRCAAVALQRVHKHRRRRRKHREAAGAATGERLRAPTCLCCGGCVDLQQQRQHGRRLGQQGQTCPGAAPQHDYVRRRGAAWARWHRLSCRASPRKRPSSQRGEATWPSLALVALFDTRRGSQRRCAGGFQRRLRPSVQPCSAMLSCRVERTGPPRCPSPSINIPSVILERHQFLQVRTGSAATISRACWHRCRCSVLLHDTALQAARGQPLPTVTRACQRLARARVDTPVLGENLVGRMDTKVEDAGAGVEGAAPGPGQEADVAGVKEAPAGPRPASSMSKNQQKKYLRRLRKVPCGRLPLLLRAAPPLQSARCGESPPRRALSSCCPCVPWHHRPPVYPAAGRCTLPCCRAVIGQMKYIARGVGAPKEDPAMARLAAAGCLPKDATANQAVVSAAPRDLPDLPDDLYLGVGGDGGAAWPDRSDWETWVRAATAVRRGATRAGRCPCMLTDGTCHCRPPAPSRHQSGGLHQRRR